MKKRLLSIFLTMTLLLGALGVPMAYAEEEAELFSSYTSVIYVSASGTIDGIDQENVRTNIAAALTKAGDSDAIIYISGEVTLPLEIGSADVKGGKITFRGHTGTSDRLLISNGSTKIYRDVTFENISVKPYRIDERWMTAHNSTITFADSCKVELSDEYVYSGKMVKTGLYIGGSYSFDGDQHYVFEDSDATVTMIAPLVGYSSTHTINGNATFDIKAGTYSALFGVARNGYSSTKYQTLNGDVRYNISGGNFSSLVSASLNGGNVNGNIVFDITGGNFAEKSVFYIGNRNVSNNEKTIYFADCTTLGNTALIFNAKELSENESTVANLTLKTATDFADLTKDATSIIFNNAEIEGFFPTATVSDVDHLLKVYNAKAYPVYAESSSGKAGALLGFDFIPDNKGYTPFVDGKELTKNANGYYDMPTSDGEFVEVYSENAIADVEFSVSFGNAAQSITVNGNIPFTLPVCEAEKENCYFDGWKCGDETYSSGESVTVSADTEFVPVWTDLSNKSAVYVCANGDDSSNGFSQYAPLKSFSVAANTAYENGLAKIVVKSAVSTGTSQVKMPAFTYPVTITGEGFDSSLYIENTFLINSPVTFEHMGISNKRYQFTVTNGYNVVFGEGLERMDGKGIELHAGKNYTSVSGNTECTVKSNIIDTMYLGGAYLKSDGVGVSGDAILNLENVTGLAPVIGFDSYGTYTGNGSIEGNVIIRMKNSHITGITTAKLASIDGSIIFITDNNSVYPEAEALPEAENGYYFINTANDINVVSAVDENGNTVHGMLNVTGASDDAKVRIYNSDIITVHSQGDIALSAGSYTIESVEGTVVSKCAFDIDAPIAGHSAKEKTITDASYSAHIEWFDGSEKTGRFEANKAYTARIEVTLYNYVEAADDLAFTVNGTPCKASANGRVYTVDYTFPATGALNAVYVSSTGNNSASGTKDAPFATMAQATKALASTGGVIYVCDKINGTGTYASNAKPILVTGAGFSDAELVLPQSQCFIAGGELVFEDLTITMDATSHINDNGNKLTIDDSVILSTGKMFHFGSYSGKSIDGANVALGLQTYIASFYLSGAYNTKESCTIENDLFLTLNDTSIGTMFVSPDSYSASHLGVTLNGNILITMNGDANIKGFGNKSNPITYSENSVYQFILNDRAVVPEISEEYISADMLYIVRSGLGGKVYHAFDENGKSISGTFDIIPDKDHMALIERSGTMILSEGGRYAFPAGETVNVSYVKTNYPLKQYRVDLDGGMAYDELIDIDSDGNITFLDAPVKTGYIFEGWYRDADRTELIKSGDFIGSQCVLYANYIPASFEYTDEEFSVKGVQIRIPTEEKEQGLRYVIAIDKAVLSSIADFSDKNASITEGVNDTIGYGAVVLPETYLGGRRLLIDEKYQLGDKIYLSKKVPANKIFDTTDEKIYFTVCITKIDVEKYENNYSVRPYISYYTRSGNYVTVYADTYDAGIITTAFEALEIGGETDDTRSYLRENILSVYAENRGIDLIPTDVLNSINEKTQLYKDSVTESENMDLSAISGKIYYVSNSGDDSNNGLSPSTAWASIAKVNASSISSGDAVLFERGGEFRGKISAKEGVTYSAYGTGKKPIINGSAQDYADPALWAATDIENLYKLNIKLTGDVGLIAFDHSRDYGDYDALFSTKRVSGVTYNGKVFVDQFDLERDLEFYHDSTDRSLYLYSTKGNPGERFSKIEIATHGNLVDVRVKNVTVDNLHIRYGGSHGVGAGSSRASYDANGNYLGMTGCANLKVTNCVFAWIGGSILSEKTRYGNAVEIFGSVDGYIVENNWIYQIYDTGITHQLSSSNCADSMMQDIEYRNNLVEYCHWSIEFYNQPCCDTHRRVVRNVLAEENILRMGGHGWGSRIRKTGATLYNSFGLSKKVEETENFHAKNNIFFRSTGPIYRLNANASERNLTFEGNIYVQDYTCYFSWYCGSHYNYSNVHELVGDGLQITDPGSEVYFYAP